MAYDKAKRCRGLHRGGVSGSHRRQFTSCCIESGQWRYPGGMMLKNAMLSRRIKGSSLVFER